MKEHRGSALLNYLFGPLWFHRLYLLETRWLPGTQCANGGARRPRCEDSLRQHLQSAKRWNYLRSRARLLHDGLPHDDIYTLSTVSGVSENNCTNGT